MELVKLLTAACVLCGGRCRRCCRRNRADAVRCRDSVDPRRAARARQPRQRHGVQRALRHTTRCSGWSYTNSPRPGCPLGCCFLKAGDRATLEKYMRPCPYFYTGTVEFVAPPAGTPSAGRRRRRIRFSAASRLWRSHGHGTNRTAETSGTAASPASRPASRSATTPRAAQAGVGTRRRGQSARSAVLLLPQGGEPGHDREVHAALPRIFLPGPCALSPLCPRRAPHRVTLP